MRQTEALLILLAVTVGLRAQSGFVRAGNQPLPGATVTATQGSQKVATTTDGSGQYVFPALAAGTWTVEVQMFGFDPAKKEINFEQTKTADFELQLSESPMAGRMARFAGTRAGGQSANQLETQLQTELDATQTPPATPAAAATGQDGNEAFLVSGSLSSGLNPNAPPDFLGMPGGPGGPGRDQLSSQAPNAPGFGGGGPGGPGGGGPGGFGGGRGGGGGFGGGRGPGGFRGARQGSQFGNRRAPSAIHGMAYFSLNNSLFNAKPFSITGQDVAQPAYANSRFGVVLGGPLVIPKIVKDTSTQFFLNYTGTRARNPYSAVETVPTALEREGDFSQISQLVLDPTTHQPFPGNLLPGVDPIAQKLLGYIPLPNQPGLVNNYQYLTSVMQNTDNFALRDST